MGVFHELYNVQLSDKSENVLKEMCWDDYYMIIGLEDRYMVNWYNNATHISILEIHIGVVYMHTLGSFPCQMMLHRYDDHVESHSFNMSKKGNYPFHQTFIFDHFDLNI